MALWFRLRQKCCPHIFLCVTSIKLCANGVASVTYTEFQLELRRASLSVCAFANLVGMNRNSVSNYAGAGEVPQHLAVIAVLLAELNVSGVNYEPALARAGKAFKKPRGRSRPGRFGGNRQEDLVLVGRGQI